MDDAEPCSFCDDSAENSELMQPVAVVEDADDGEAEPEWRQEVGRRLAQYRARRGYSVNIGDDAAAPATPAVKQRQVDLPFRLRADRGGADRLNSEESQPTEKKQPARPRTLARLRPAERMEICIQPELDFSAAAGERAHPQTALVPVATLGERRVAALVDIIFILLTGAAFAGLFVGLMRSLGWEIVVDRIDALMCVPVLFLVYALYFLVFTFFAGSTPGMQLCGLSIVRLDGRLPDTAQLLWRSFGYLLSGVALSLGFLWAFWDEDGFTWHDRISQTYVTASLPLVDSDTDEIRLSRMAAAAAWRSKQK
jgi:uncharacterized RDD family membrane protein YckC